MIAPSDSQQILALGINHLTLRGLNAFADDIEVKAASSFDELRVSDKSCFLVDSSTFILHLDFFVIRKSHTVVYLDRDRERVFADIHNTDDNSSKNDLAVIFRNDDEDTVCDILRKVVRGNLSLGENNSSEEQRSLSQRETEVLREIAHGLTNKEIASRLSISVNTVITHRKNLSIKLGIRSASGLSLYALMNGII